MILAIDPGSEQSGYVLFDPILNRVCGCGVVSNFDMLAKIEDAPLCAVVIEQAESFGQKVWSQVFTTVWWSGRMWQVGVLAGHDCGHITRRAVKMTLCGTASAKDPQIRNALIDRYGPVGTKLKPGPLYGIKSHCWSALALAVTFDETKQGA